MPLTPDQKLAVERIWRAYKDDPVGHGRWGQKYVIGPNTIQVVLTPELFEFSEAAAGVMGYGARPVGIRRSVNDAHKTMDSIMESAESLEQFILSSDCSGPAYAESVRERRNNPKKAIMASDANQGFWHKYGKDEMARIKAKFADRQQLINDFQSMTLDAFEEKYMMPA
jgi:hypothetical protein